MDERKENDLLEETLSIAETDYAQAYRFLLGAYEKKPGGFGPQTLYFLACLAGGAGMPDAALGWLRTAIEKNGWWYRPEVLVDDDLAQLEGSPEFLALKARSGSCLGSEVCFFVERENGRLSVPRRPRQYAEREDSAVGLGPDSGGR